MISKILSFNLNMKLFLIIFTFSFLTVINCAKTPVLKTMTFQESDEIFPNPEYPTSVSSISRAIRINLQYGTVIRKGTRKSGYTYHLPSDAEIMTAMFQNFIDMNNNFLGKLLQFKALEIKNDDVLLKAVEFQIKGVEIFNQILEGVLDSAREAFSFNESNV